MGNESSPDRQAEIENRMDEALLESFPASDPPAWERSARISFEDEELLSGVLYGQETEHSLACGPISTQRAHPEFIRAYLQVKKAAAQANLHCGSLTKTEADLILRAIALLLARPNEEFRKHFPIDAYQAGAGTSQNMNLNEVIATLANRFAQKLGLHQPVIHPNDHVNRSQSTNDTYPTAMRIGLLRLSDALKSELHLSAESLKLLAKRFEWQIKAGRTHLQDAIPIFLGDEIGAYASAIDYGEGLLLDAQSRLRVIGIGGTAVGNRANTPKDFSKVILSALSKNTQQAFIRSENLFFSTQSQIQVGFYSSTLKLIAIELTRICNDLRLLASGPCTGLFELILPEVQAGSSIMPGKVNPSILEMTNQALFSVMGYDHTVQMASQAGQLELNVMMPILAFSVFEATSILTHSLHVLRTQCIDGIQVNHDRLTRYAESTPQIATFLSPILGYAITAKLVKESIAQNIPVLELALKTKRVTETQLREIRDRQRFSSPDAKRMG